MKGFPLEVLGEIDYAHEYTPAFTTQSKANQAHTVL